MQYSYASQLRPDEIRILKLKPGLEDELLNCELETCRSGTISYDALSYAWGNPRLDHDALCDGKLLPITKSLCTLLRALRLNEGKGLQLWVDAVCINQADVRERTEQVRRMSDIYREADSVLIWLGAGHEDTDQGLQLLSRTCKAYPSLNGERIEDLWLDNGDGEQGFESAAELVSLGLFDTSSGNWQTAAKLLDYKWFTRRWVIQEFMNAKRRVFRVGKHEVSPEVLLGGFFRMASMQGLRFALTGAQRRVAENVDSMVQLLRRPHAEFSHEALCELLLETADFHSSDIRDKIFAIVGCFEDPPTGLVDYSKTFPELLIEIVRCESGRQALVEAIFRGLCYIDEPSDDPFLASWVPTWNFSTKLFAPIGVDENEGNLEWDQADVRIIDDKILESSVVIFDEIALYSEAQKYDDPLPLWFHTPEEQRQMLISATRKDCDTRISHLRIAKTAVPLNGFDLEDFLACQIWGVMPEDMDVVISYTAGMRHRSLIFAQSEAKNTRDLVQQYGSYLERYEIPHDDALKADSTQEEINSRLEELSSLRGFLSLSLRSKYQRRFFASKRGLMGWVPKAARKGDRIGVLFGNAMPFILRPLQQADASSELMSYSIIGAAYVHGHMDGEPFMDDSLPRKRIRIV